MLWVLLAPLVRHTIFVVVAHSSLLSVSFGSVDEQGKCFLKSRQLSKWNIILCVMSGDIL
jgi:hypothetical protein